jgi:hypothetical membrane protein
MKNFLFCCITILICRLIAAYVFCTFDDAYITYRYAWNLASGNGLVYNLHEKVLGTTAPLFAFIGAIPMFFSLSLPKFFVGFNILCDLGSLYLVYRFIFNRNKVMLILFTILFSLDPAANRISVGGMEANLFLLCSLLGIVLYFNQRKPGAFLLLSIIYFLRPEAILLFLVLICYEWYSEKKVPWKYFLYCLLLMAPLFIIMYAYYGHVFPQSVIIKNLGSPRPLSDLVRNIFFPHVFNYMLFPLAVFGIIHSVREIRYFMILFLWIVCYVSAYLIRGPWILNWYIYSIEIVQLIFATRALEKFSSWFPSDLSKYKIFNLAPLFTVLIWICIGYWLGRNTVEVNVYDQLKKDFSRNKISGSMIFFADDIGALGYYSGAYMYDNLMLVTPQAARFSNARDRILHVNPDFLYLYTDTYYLKLLTGDPELSAKYHFVKRYSRYGEGNLPALAEIGNTGYRLDYMLWKRND